jgi:hypothetical protein
LSSSAILLHRGGLKCKSNKAQPILVGLFSYRTSNSASGVDLIISLICKGEKKKRDRKALKNFEKNLKHGDNL